MKLTTKEITVFGMLGAVMYVSKIVMEAFPNIHLLGVFTMALTIAYREKALYPIYTYVLINGLFAGFAAWWIPYLYIWTILWGVTMLLPKNMPKKAAYPVYMTVCGLHGILFGTLYAPFHALMFGLDFKETLAWITAGIPWDIVHCIGNFASGILIVPLVKLLRGIKIN